MKNIFVVLVLLLVISCTATAPIINGYQYLGTISQTKVGSAYTKVYLDNGTNYATTDTTITTGDYVYRDKYGQLKVVSPE